MSERVSILVCELPLGDIRQSIGVLAGAIRWVVRISDMQEMPPAQWPGWDVDASQCRWGLVLATEPATWLPVAEVSTPKSLTPQDVHPVPLLLAPWADRHNVLAFYVGGRQVVPIVRLL